MTQALTQHTRNAIIAVILLSALFHACTFFLAKSYLSLWRFEHIPIHTAVEVAGAMIAMFVAYTLIRLEHNHAGTSFNYPIAAALTVMGCLDFAHAIIQPGLLFVWLHSWATFFGGCVFALIVLPKYLISSFRVTWVLAACLFTCMFVLCSFIFVEHLPAMVIDGRFSLFATVLNICGGILLLIAAAKLTYTYYQHIKVDDLLFVLHCTMFGFAAVMFDQSVLWDVSWWGWHLLRFFAYGVALWFAINSEQITNVAIKDNRDELADEAKHTVQQLEMSQAQQKALFECLTDAIIICDGKGVMTFFSRQATEMFGYQADEVLNKNITQLMSNDQAKQHDQHMAGYQTKDTSTVVGQNRELIARKKNGELFPISLVINELTTLSERSFVGIITDITHIKQREKDLQDAKIQAESAVLAKSAFLANTSHEIRTPMNGIYGILQLLESEPLSPKGQHLLQQATYSTKALMCIINDILDFSKIEAGKLNIENLPFGVSGLLAHIESDMAMHAQNKGLNFKLVNTIDHDQWYGDSLRIRQILINLLSNAIKFTEQGTVTLTCSTDTLLNDMHTLVFVINDTGIGMSKSALNKLFERFEQADNSTTRKFGGTGLGMSIVFSLTTLMDGKIKVKSEEGVGTTFTITLPLKQADSLQEQTLGTITAQQSLEGLRILVAEDNPVNQIVVLAMLDKHGIHTTLANNGLEALKLAQQHDFDLILMDIQMPEMDGLTAFKHIKEAKPNQPIIALTANVMSEDVEHYFKTGFAEVIGKPIDQPTLISKIHSVARLSSKH